MGILWDTMRYYAFIGFFRVCQPIIRIIHNDYLVGGILTPVKNIGQLGWLFPIIENIVNVPDHQPDAGVEWTFGEIKWWLFSEKKDNFKYIVTSMSMKKWWMNGQEYDRTRRWFQYGCDNHLVSVDITEHHHVWDATQLANAGHLQPSLSSPLRRVETMQTWWIWTKLVINHGS